MKDLATSTTRPRCCKTRLIWVCKKTGLSPKSNKLSQDETPSDSGGAGSATDRPAFHQPGVLCQPPLWGFVYHFAINTLP